MSKQKYPQTANVSSDGQTRIRPIKKNGYSQIKNHAKQDRKRQEAYARQDAYEKLTLTKQLESLVPGGSNKQRKKLAKLME